MIKKIFSLMVVSCLRCFLFASICLFLIVGDGSSSGKTAQEYFNAGISLVDEGKLDDAERMFAEAVRLEPRHSYYRYAWAVTLGGNQRYAEAVEELKKVVKELPELQQAWYYLRIYWLKSGDKDAAREYFAKMVKKRSGSAAVRLNYAYILLELKEYDNAEKAINEAIKLRPTYSEAYFCLAMVENESRSDIDKAIEYYTKSIQLDPEFAEAYFNLAQLQLKKNNMEEADKNFKIARELKPRLAKQVELVYAEKEQLRAKTTLRGPYGSVDTVTLVIYFPDGVVKIVGEGETVKEKAKRAVDKAIKGTPQETKMEVIFGREKSIFDFRTTPNFYVKFDKVSGEIAEGVVGTGEITKLNMIVRKIPDINLRFDPEGVIVKDTEVNKGYSYELTKGYEIKVVDILPEESKVVIAVKRK